MTPGIRALMIANGAVFLVQMLTLRVGGTAIEPLFGLQPEQVIHKPFFVWQLVTYMFLHSTGWIFHVVLNMLMLWMFGAEVERAWGTRPFLRYYFVCGIGAALTTCVLFPHSLTIGASGAVFGVMLAYALMFPNRQILFWFIFPMRAVSFVLLCAVIEMAQLLEMQDGIAHIAHLGGMLFGYLYLKRAWRIRPFLSELHWRLRRRRFRVVDRPDQTPRPDRHYPYH
ncbi:MAG TPA: rhomboid family intramembrane serine protease [Patescibacteria group bacterium]|nr:rhomboid family intramembrane serine protease [Patescibacteria group bacterium]